MFKKLCLRYFLRIGHGSKKRVIHIIILNIEARIDLSTLNIDKWKINALK